VVKMAVVFGCLAMLMLPACAPIRQRVDISRGGVVGNPRQKIQKTNPAKSSPSSNPSVRGQEPWSGELEGLASWYGADFNGHLTASGEVYDMYDMTAAHKTLPLQTRVKVHNLENGKAVQVRINDRGPYVEGRVIDLSRKAARALGMRDQGTVKVKLEILKLPESGP
jgi:rare lipoprotein A (peptidoglycan hydrolase)